MLKNKFLYVIFYSYFIKYKQLKNSILNTYNSLFNERKFINICMFLLTVLSLPAT